MCYDLCDCSHKEGRCAILGLTFLATLFSIGVAVSMGILMYPGFDECLLFVGVRGEALIYGNPHGCNFMIVGHAGIILTGFVVLYLLFIRKAKGFVRRNAGSGNTMSKTGAPSTYSSNPTALQNWNRNHGSTNDFDANRLSTHYSSAAIIISMLLASFSLLTALVCLSGYLVTCDELSYETTRQIHGRTTLGTPYRQLSIHCWSLFRDQDFHTRFHYDHLEYSGQWHGQYRGYKHGRVHSVSSDHEHAIGVAEALEICMACSWIASVIWIAITSILIHLRRKSKKAEKRELAESLEDARIFASSRHIMDGGFPHPGYSQQTMPLNSIKNGHTPNDQVSMISSNSHAVKRPFSSASSNTSFVTPYASLDLPKPSGQGIRPSSVHAQSIAGYPAQTQFNNPQLQQPTMKSSTSGPILQQQQMLLTQQMQQMQQLQEQQQLNGSVQYVQLSNGLLVPTSSISNQPTVTVAQPVDISTSLLQSQMVAATNQQLQQQQLQISQQLQQAQNKKLGVQTTPQRTQEASKRSTEVKAEETPNSPQAQIEQVDLSNDIGMKCSQI